MNRERILPMVALLCLALAASAMATTASATLYTVGPGAACDTSSIQTAINMADVDGDVIRITTAPNYTAQALVITNQSVTLAGGYANCSDVEPSGHTTISGAGGTPTTVLEITGNIFPVSTPPFVVTLKHLQITDGDWPAGACCEQDGGGILARGNLQLVLRHTIVKFNTASDGGGIFFDGRNPATSAVYPNAKLRVLDGSDVKYNDAVGFPGSTSGGRGGGIACVQGAIEIDEGSSVLGNFATDGSSDLGGLGAGIFLTECELHTYSSFIAANTADASGGGIWAASSELFLLKDPSAAQGTVVASNVSGTSDHPHIGGGGLFLSNSSLFAEGLQLVDNNANRGYGGGLFAVNGSSVTVQRPGADSPCSAPCNLIQGNSAVRTTSIPVPDIVGGFGGGMALIGGSTAELRQLRIEDNTAGLEASAIYIRGHGDGSVLLDGALVTGHVGGGPGTYTIYSDDAAELSIVQSTFADNPFHGASIKVLEGGAVNLRTSVFSEPHGHVIEFSSDFSGSIFIGGDIVHDNTNMGSSAVVAYADRDILFQAPEQGNYWPRVYRPVVFEGVSTFALGPLLDSALHLPGSVLIDGHGLERGFDVQSLLFQADPGLVNYDIGAFESDAIFLGFFEVDEL